MDIFAFFGGVWISIAVGIFIIAMVIGCTVDRRHQESMKWWVFFIGVITFTGLTWDSSRPIFDTWNLFWSRGIWVYVAWYLGIGVVYSLVEFGLEVRRSVRIWAKRWNEHKQQFSKTYVPLVIEGTSPLIVVSVRAASVFSDSDLAYRRSRVSDFIIQYQNRGCNTGPGIIVIRSTDYRDAIEPSVNRKVLAENIGCMTIFWPFYAVSLIIGDLMAEVFRVIADVVASLSARIVRASFKNVFKF